MRGNRIRIALAQTGINQFPILHGKHLAQDRKSCIRMRKKKRLRLCGGLHRNALALQIRQCFNLAVPIDCHHLTAHHIRRAPTVFLLAPINRKAAPDAVDFSAVNQLLLFLPVDIGKHRLISHAAKGFCR